MFLCSTECLTQRLQGRTAAVLVRDQGRVSAKAKQSPLGDACVANGGDTTPVLRQVCQQERRHLATALRVQTRVASPTLHAKALGQR
jgi:hypothetical protein